MFEKIYDIQCLQKGQESSDYPHSETKFHFAWTIQMLFLPKPHIYALKSHIQHYLQKPTDLHHQRPNRVHIYPRVLVVSVLYQLLFGSPKHSPTVTGLYPLLVKPFNIYSTSTCEVWLWISWLMTRKSFVVGEDTFRAVSNIFSELMIRMGESLR
jgi:hypothetical protein